MVPAVNAAAGRRAAERVAPRDAARLGSDEVTRSSSSRSSVSELRGRQEPPARQTCRVLSRSCRKRPEEGSHHAHV